MDVSLIFPRLPFSGKPSMTTGICIGTGRILANWLVSRTASCWRIVAGALGV
ncbi:msl3425 [Mesorhizobium japonicum MAFF 303099]|uniref:Msl3425 protein n=1 Tax=Mesorhizobium japonicum (strain LMG 29417 / CECT 9101 / MAFF 303099) TaxID=266835 RepID=Q98GA0_RHILO|nr:msl3425 [Mesorhizobium japonicum MAFF 303099]